ncbi:AAA family ATPase [candidate division KSB1 bacterium]|nr:AAA family ATPase [candidate division KSB1 bacterium]
MTLPSSSIHSNRDYIYSQEIVEKIKHEFEVAPITKLIIIQGVMGAGKTSTLTRIIDDHDIPGPNYISAYIDTREIEPGAFFLNTYRALRTALLNSGINLLTSDLSLRLSIAEDELTLFMDDIAEKTDENVILLLMYDEIHFLHDVIDNETLEHIFQFFHYLLTKQDKFRLILAGNQNVYMMMNKSVMSELVNSASRIDLNMFLETPSFESMQRELEKHCIECDATAQQEIFKITGGNLYCQQLLIESISHYLSRVNRVECHTEDVFHVANNLIRGKRDDFLHFWQRLDYRSRIVAVALSDKAITQKFGNYYIFNGHKLLDAIFTDEELNSIFVQLYENGYINKIDHRLFLRNPFKVPLYGMWVTASRSLLRTVAENLDKIAFSVPLHQIENILNIIPWNVIPRPIDNIKQIIRLAQCWSGLQEKLHNGVIDQDDLDCLVKIVCNILDFIITNEPDDKKSYYTINMGSLDLDGLENVLLFVPKRMDISELDINYFQDAILKQDKPANPSMMICLRKSSQISRLVDKKYLGIVLLEENDIKNIAVSSRPIQYFKQEILLKQVKPSIISPYKTDGPVKATFYGRQDEIGRILRSKSRNFAIVGARKLGKTSLLLKIKDNMPSNSLPIYLDIESPAEQNYDTFIHTLLSKLKQYHFWCMDGTDEDNDLRSIIVELRKRVQKIPVLLIDEIDKLLMYDSANNYNLIETFRSMYQEELCQVIFSGFEELFKSSRSIRSPLYNFCEVIELEKLKEEDALSLITQPMENLGIHYESPLCHATILEKTSCHPNLLQYVSKNLIERIENNRLNGTKRIIAQTDIDDFFESFKYENYVVNDFYLFFTNDIHPIERLIVVFALQHHLEGGTFTLNHLKTTLSNHNVKLSSVMLNTHLSNLMLRYIFIPQQGGKYQFALPVFPEILKRRNNIENFVEETIEDARKSI